MDEGRIISAFERVLDVREAMKDDGEAMTREHYIEALAIALETQSARAQEMREVGGEGG